MGCCRGQLPFTKSGGRSVICLKYVAPLRIVTVISIWGNALYTYLHLETLSLTIKFLIIIHLFLAIYILLECRRSESFHKIYGELASKRTNPEKNKN